MISIGSSVSVSSGNCLNISLETAFILMVALITGIDAVAIALRSLTLDHFRI